MTFYLMNFLVSFNFWQFDVNQLGEVVEDTEPKVADDEVKLGMKSLIY